jgi:streptomycin 6-kinase
MSTQTRTAGHWHVAENPHGDQSRRFIWPDELHNSDDTGYCIATVQPRAGCGDVDANAAFIVEACNAHDSLVAEVARLREVLAVLAREHTCERYPLAADWSAARAALSQVQS